jgi:imidazolonepropionase-like amidohydrolase
MNTSNVLSMAMLLVLASSLAASAEEAPKKPARHLAIRGATVHTVTGPVLAGATVLCRDGKITAIGSDIQIPEGAEVIDAAGHHLYPGLVVAGGTQGLVGGGNPEDSTDVYSLGMTLGLAGGLTTVVSDNQAAKLTQGAVGDIVLKRNLFERISYTSRNPGGRRALREAFERVREHLRATAEYERRKAADPEAKKPDDKWIQGEYERVLRLLEGRAVALVSAGEGHEILEACALAKLYGFKLVIEDAREGWTAASEMARSGASAIIMPRERVDPDERTGRPTGATTQNARILHEHGVPLAIATAGYISLGGMAGRDLQHLPMEAAYAVRGGLSDEAALAAITIDAARILGVDDRIGSVEVGKDADFAIADGDILHYMTHVRWTVVNGRVAYDRMKDTLFDHIRPPADAGSHPAVDHWPRSLGDDR